MIRKLLTLMITFVMLVFTLQYSVISIIKLSDTLTKNFLQNPVAEEEEDDEEEETNHAKHPHFICTDNLFSFNYLVLFVECFFPLSHINSCSPFCKTMIEPPESKYLS